MRKLSLMLLVLIMVSLLGDISSGFILVDADGGKYHNDANSSHYLSENSVIVSSSNQSVETHIEELHNSGEYEYSEWIFPSLEYRIPIMIENLYMLSNSYLPVVLHFNFTDVSERPQNYSLLMVRGNDTIRFQITNYKSNGTHLLYFDLVFVASMEFYEGDVLYLYYSSYERDLASYGIDRDIYGYEYINNELADMSVSCGNMSVDVYSKTINGISYKFLEVNDSVYVYRFLLSSINQTGGFVGDSTALKQGLLHVETSQVLFNNSVYINSSSDPLSDLEDFLNGPYRFESHALFIYNSSNYFYGVYSPAIDEAEMIRIYIGPILARISFEKSPLREYYYEGNTTSKIIDHLYENISYTFYLGSGYITKNITIINERTETIVINDDDTLGGLTNATYGQYYRYTVSPQDIGSLMHFVVWYDDPDSPTGNYTRYNSSNGLPRYMDYIARNEYYYVYGLWDEKSQGRSFLYSCASLIIGTNYFGISVDPKILSGSYVVYPNVSESPVYDGMYSLIGFDYSPLTVNPYESISLGFQIKFGDETSMDYIDNMISLLSLNLTPEYRIDRATAIQYINSCVRISVRKIWSAYNNINYTDAEIRLYYGGSELPYFNVSYAGPETNPYRVYYYSTILEGNFTLKVMKYAIMAMLNYTTYVWIENSTQNITEVIPVTDFNVSYYDPTSKWIDFNNNTRYNYFDGYEVCLTLNSSIYVAGGYGEAYAYGWAYCPAIVEDVILGNYTVHIYPSQPISSGVPIDEYYYVSIDWNNASSPLIAFADIGVVKVHAVDSNGYNITHFSVNISGLDYSIIDGTNGRCVIRDVPLYNRTSAINVTLRVTVIYSIMGVNVTNATCFNLTDSELDIYLVLSDVRTLKLFIYSSANENIVIEDIYRLMLLVRNGTGPYYKIYGFEAYNNSTVINIPDSSIYNLSDIYINVTYKGDYYLVSNETYVGSVESIKEIEVVLPIVLHFYLYTYSFDGVHKELLYGAYLQMESEDHVIMIYEELYYGYTSIDYVPSDILFNITVVYSTNSSLTLVNSSTMYIDMSCLEVYFYMRDINLYIVPEYNQSEGIVGAEVEVYLNYSYLISDVTNMFGYITVPEFPSPIYGYNELLVSYWMSIYDYEYYGSKTIIVTEDMFYSNITIKIPLKMVVFNFVSPSGEPMSGFVDIYSREYSPYMLLDTISIENGYGEFELCPTDLLYIELELVTKWGYSVKLSKNITLNESIEYITLVAPLRTLDIYVDTYDGIPLGEIDVYVEIYDENMNPLGFAYGVTNVNGTVLIDEIPYIGSIIIIDYGEFIVDKIFVYAYYSVIGDVYVDASKEVTHDAEMIHLPLGNIEIYAYYNSSRGLIPITNGTIIDLFVEGYIYKRINLSIENVFYLVPLYKNLMFYVSYYSRYNVTVTRSIDYVLSGPTEKITIFVPIGDLDLYFYDFDDLNISSLNITIRTYGLTFDMVLNNTNHLSLAGIPFGIYGIAIRMDTSLGFIYEQKLTLDFDKTQERTIHLSIRSIHIEVYDEKGESLNGLMLSVSVGNYMTEFTSNINSFNLTAMPLGIYTISLYYWFGGSIYPLNYSNYILDISTTDRHIVFYAKFASLTSEMVLNSTIFYQNSTIRVGTYIYDAHGNAIPGLAVYIELRDKEGDVLAYNKTYEETPGYYVGYLYIGNIRHGEYLVVFKVQVGERYADVASTEITIKTNPPEISFSFEQYLILAIIIIAFSLFVSILQYRLSKAYAREPEKNIKYMYLLYAIGMATAISLFLLSYFDLINPGFQILSYAMSFLLIIVLYGLWIYMDGYKSIKLRMKTRLSLALGLVHMFIPIYIMQIIIQEGATIEWFQEYIIEQQSSLGPIHGPALFISFLTAYVTTYLVVVFTAYRDIAKARQKVLSMSRFEVPEKLIQSEENYQLRRLSSGIRIRILLFLGLLGLSLITALPFLKTISLLIVVIPIILLIIGPYISYTLTGFITKSQEF